MKLRKTLKPYLFRAGILLFLIFFLKPVINKMADFKENTVTEESYSSLQKAEIIRVIDGDTIIVSVNDEEKTVRLIGVDSPESVNPDSSKNTVAGKVASDFTKSQLPKGLIVYLEKDTSDTDKYGRLLRYVWLSENVDLSSDADIQKYCYNAILVMDGYARAVKYEPDTKRYLLFKALE